MSALGRQAREKGKRMGAVIRLNQYGGKGWQETGQRIYQAIAQGEEFQSGALKATKGKRYTWQHKGNVGELPEAWHRVIINDDPDYVVWSYDTPIAWHYTVPTVAGRGEREQHIWVIPDVKYSRTTSRHQNFARGAVALNEGEPITTLPDAE